MRARAIVMALATALVLPACGGGGKKQASSPEGGELPPPDMAWKDMKMSQRKEYMEHVVFPKMKDLFVAFDAKKFAEFSCETCHGDGAVDGSFEMPNPKLFKLPKTAEGFGKLAAEKPDWMKFMGGTVKPEMAKLLGMPELDPEKQPDGFGCMHCHATE